MEFRNKRDVGDYMGQYQQGYGRDGPARYGQGAQYVPDGRSSTILINPKQLYWIQKRQIRREMLDSMMVQQSNNYMHESRHRHAMKRMRAPSGRFLTKEEMDEMKRKEEGREEAFDMREML